MSSLALGLDIAKTVFQAYCIDGEDKPRFQRKLRRGEVLRFFARLEPCLIGIEACHGSHYWGRELSKLGHQVRLIPTQYVKPYLLGGKNDANDAAAICAALKRAEAQYFEGVKRITDILTKGPEDTPGTATAEAAADNTPVVS